MMQFETNEEKREACIASLDAIAALEPKIVVAGHKRAGLRDLPEHISASQQYLRDFTRIARERDTVDDLVSGMMELHGDRDNPTRCGSRHAPQWQIGANAPRGDGTPASASDLSSGR